MRLLLFHNPHAGGGRAARLLPRIRQAMQDQGFASEVVPGDDAANMADRLARPSIEGFSGIVAVGGDGTVFSLLNALYPLRPPGRAPARAAATHPPQNHPAPPLGIIPVGTGNAFARDLGLEPGDWRGAVDVLAAARTRFVDVGCIETPGDVFHFVNVAGAGFVVDAGRAAQRLKRFGRSAYTLAALWEVLRLRTRVFRVEIDGSVVEERALLVEISNTRYTGTRFLIAPGAEPDDGLLDVTVVRSLPRWRLLWLFPTIFSGRHVEHPAVSVIRGCDIRLESPAGEPLMVDGEFRGTVPARIRCLPRELEVFCR